MKSERVRERVSEGVRERVSEECESERARSERVRERK